MMVLANQDMVCEFNPGDVVDLALTPVGPDGNQLMVLMVQQIG